MVQRLAHGRSTSLWAVAKFTIADGVNWPMDVLLARLSWVNQGLISVITKDRWAGSTFPLAPATLDMRSTGRYTCRTCELRARPPECPVSLDRWRIGRCLCTLTQPF